MPSRWSEFKNAAPDLCEIGESRLHGRLAYLATVRKDGSPRVFPVGPFTDGESLWLFVGGKSPKRYDLLNDGRYALHCSVEDNQGGAGEFHVTGEVARVSDQAVRSRAVDNWPGDDPILHEYLLFELLVSTAMYTTYTDGVPSRQRWNSPDSA